MVKICQAEYPKENVQKYLPHFEKYSYELSSFQKFAIEAIVEGQHTLSCVPTGSGKTLAADFAIDFFVQQNKRVIYTAPIKALVNNKYYEFSQKYPNYTFGIISGDIKFNPDANVLLMTTEILQNTLYRKKQSNSLLSFEMDFDNELACVIFDEVHFIGDAERGRVWEECIINLPTNIQMCMLSATLSKPECFAKWVESHGEKEVYLATSSHRIVPLTHYSFITCTQGIFKVCKDKELEQNIRKTINQLHVIQTPEGEFNESNYFKINKMLALFENKKQYIKRAHVLNQVCKYMVENNMLPAVCFILSRRQIEIASREITTILLEDDSKIPYIVRRECEQILRDKIPNFKEYIELPEYNYLVSLLEKGIGIHHSGIMPILREMVEILFMKGYIKLLFATETIAVGINTPTKTAIFTDVTKFDGSNIRMLHPHEFVQASGRAGRRGLDKIGHVIHLTNLFRNVNLADYRIMMQGKPQTLISKFKISYHLLLNLIESGNQDLLSFCRQSMIQGELLTEIQNHKTAYQSITEDLQRMDNSILYLKTPVPIINQFIQAEKERQTVVNKKRKMIEKEIEQIKNEYKFIETEKLTIEKYNKKIEERDYIQLQITNTEDFLMNNINIILTLLEDEGFICKTDDSSYILKNIGFIAPHLREIHCLTFANLISDALPKLEPVELVSLFSCFTNVTVQEDYKSWNPDSNFIQVNNIVKDIVRSFSHYQDFENRNNLFTGVDYSIQFDLLNYVAEWCQCTTIEDCKSLLQKMEAEKGIFLGEFVKAILKINNISNEIQLIAESIGNMELVSKLKQIPELTLKFVATNQSLYI